MAMIELCGHQMHHSALLCLRSVIFEALYEMQFNHDRKIRLVDGRCASHDRPRPSNNLMWPNRDSVSYAKLPGRLFLFSAAYFPVDE